jgi:cation diffusion facilitator family transporter
MAASPVQEQRSSAIRLVLRRVLYLNLAVVALKAAAFMASGALSILAEVAHSSLDAINNVFALGVARIASQEPDEQHPYGHRKFETLGALLLAGLLSVAVYELVRSALRRLSSPLPVAIDASPLAFGLMAIGVVAGLAISSYEARRGRALQSSLLLADAAHTRSDVFTTLGVLGGLALTRAGLPRADAWVTLAVAATIAWTGWKIVQEVVPVLVDERAVPPEDIRALAESHEGVAACYGIRSRGRAGDVFAELTVALDPTLSVQAAHDIADDVERRVTAALGAHTVVVHVEPARAPDRG